MFLDFLVSTGIVTIDTYFLCSKGVAGKMAWHHAYWEDSRVGGGTVPVFRPQVCALRSWLNLEFLFCWCFLPSSFCSHSSTQNVFLSAGCGGAFQLTFDFIIPSLPRRPTSPPRTSTQFQGRLSLSHCWSPLICPTESSHASARYKYLMAKALVFRLWSESLSLSRFRGLFTKVWVPFGSPILIY